MACNGRVGVLDQPRCSITKVQTLAFTFPVALDAPSASFARMAEARPAIQLMEELSIHPVKRFLGDTGAIVLRPALNLGIEHIDEGRLRCAFVPADHLTHFLQMSLAGFVAWLDERLETRLSAASAGMVSSHPMLPDVETEEVKAHVSFVLVERMGLTGLAGLQS